MMKKRVVVVYWSLFFCGLMQPAKAYLDPGSGSMLLQILLGGAAGIAVIGKLYWNNLLMFFGMRKNQDTKGNSDSDPPQSEG